MGGRASKSKAREEGGRRRDLLRPTIDVAGDVDAQVRCGGDESTDDSEEMDAEDDDRTGDEEERVIDLTKTPSKGHAVLKRTSPQSDSLRQFLQSSVNIDQSAPVQEASNRRATAEELQRVVRIECAQVISQSLRPDDPVRIRACLRSLNAMASIEVDVSFECMRGEFFEPCTHAVTLELPPLASQTFEFEVEPQHVNGRILSLSTLPKHQIFRVVASLEEEEFGLCEMHVPIPVEPYFALHLHLPPLTVLLLGPPGSAKSSIVNAIGTSFVWNGDDACSHLLAYTLAMCGTAQASPNSCGVVSMTRAARPWRFHNVTLVDTIAINFGPDGAPMNYAPRLKQRAGESANDALLNFVRSGWCQKTQQGLIKCSELPHCQFDAVLFAQDVNNDGTKESNEWCRRFSQELRAFCHAVRFEAVVLTRGADEMGIPLLWAVTKLDEGCYEEEFDVHESKRVPGAIDRVASRLQVPANTCLPVANYVHHRERTWSIGRACHVLLQRLYFISGKLGGGKEAKTNGVESDDV